MNQSISETKEDTVVAAVATTSSKKRKKGHVGTNGETNPGFTSAKTNASLSKFSISNICYQNEHDVESFCILLDPKKHGLYDLIDAVFKHSLTEITEEGWNITSRLWTADYGDKRFVRYVEKALLGLYEIDPHLCSSKQRRVFCSEEMQELVGFKRGTDGYFSMDNEPLKFQFKLIETNAPMDMVDAGQLPKCIAEESKITYTANKEAEFVSPAEQIAVDELTVDYELFYNGLNSWSNVSSIYEWEPSCPPRLEWTKIEIEIMSLFKKGGWKFANSWKYGMQYAFVHRTKTGTQQRWYTLHKASWVLCGGPWAENTWGDNLNDDGKIIRAKKLCKQMMDEMLEQGAPRPFQKPRERRRDDHRLKNQSYDSVLDETTFREKRYDYLPKRLRTKY